MLTTTSTSYILLASLDAARKHLAIEGEKELKRVIALAHSARKQLNEINGLHCIGEECLTSSATFAHDPTKLFISLNELSISGYEAEVWLRDRYGIEVELSDLYNILCIITLGDDQSKIDLLIKAMTELAASFQQTDKQSISLSVKVPDIPTLAISPRDAFYSQTEFVSFDQSAGRIIAEFIMVYPPGIPILSPGELITQENLEYVKENMEAGLPVQGPEDQTLAFLKVIKEQSAIQ